MTPIDILQLMLASANTGCLLYMLATRSSNLPLYLINAIAAGGNFAFALS